MYIDSAPSTTTSSRDMFSYLEKESRRADSASREFTEYLDKENRLEISNDPFFNHESYKHSQADVCHGIDSNCKGLKRNENRFFSITISPSQKELRHMATLADKGADELVKLGISDNRDEAKEWLMRDMLKKYT